MKKVILIGCIISCLYTFGQTKEVIEKDLISEKQFDKLILTNFSKFATGQSASNIASYAGFDVEKSEVTFSPTWNFKSGNILGVKMTGGITDGIYSVFNNSKLNTNLSGEIQYHFIYNKVKKSIIYSKAEFDKMKEREIQIEKEYQNDIAKIQASFDKNALIIANETKLLNNEKLQKENSELEIKLKEFNTPNQTEIVNAKIQNNNFTIAQNKIDIESNKQTIKDYDGLKEQLKAGNKKALSLQENDISKLKLEGFRFSWLTFSYKIRNDEFRLLNPMEVYNKQVSKESYLSHEFKSQFSYVNVKSATKATYLTSSFNLGLNSNINFLDKIEVTETNTFGTTTNQTRELSKKYFAYQGNYRTSLKQITIDTHFYHFPFEKSEIGFHLFPNSKFTDRAKPVYNFGGGIIFPFTNKIKEKSVINAEIYYNIVNVFNSKDSTYDLFERNNIGLRFTLPISFKPYN